MIGGLSQPTAHANTQAFPTDDANCRDSIRNDPKIMLGSYVKRAQTISFVESGFERLGLGHRMVVRVSSGQRISSEESGKLYALLILLVSRTPWLGGRVVPPPLTLPLLSFYTGIYPLTNVHV